MLRDHGAFAFLPHSNYVQSRLHALHSRNQYRMTQETKGMWLGLIGVAMFSLTLPFTRIAVAELNPVLVACGRAFVAGICSVVLLWHKGAAWPTGAQWNALAITAAGVIIGFPVFMSIAMYYVTARS